MKWHLIQLRTALIYNLDFRGFAEVSIYKGKRKGLCVPGLNCYSCPGAIGPCPLGTPQNFLAVMDRRLSFYILGILLLSGTTLGRTIRGFSCPFGSLQELLYKIPLPKIKKNRSTMALSKAKYAALAVFVIVLSIALKAVTRVPVPASCKYICPAGTLEGGIPLVPLDESLGSLANALFSWKVPMLAVILLSACFLYRGFCRFLCSLGVVHSLFVSVTLLGVKVDYDVCMDYRLYVYTCKMDVGHVGDMECIQCGGCMKECGVDAAHWKKPLGRQRCLHNITFNEYVRSKAFSLKSNTRYKGRVPKILYSVTG